MTIFLTTPSALIKIDDGKDAVVLNVSDPAGQAMIADLKSQLEAAKEENRSVKAALADAKSKLQGRTV